MKHNYKIHGVTSEGEWDQAKKILSKVEGVIKVSVDKVREDAVIEMRTHISIETFQKALHEHGGKYSISVAQGIVTRMEHSYFISGMKGKEDIAHVQQMLSNVEGVTGVSVDLEKSKAVIEMRTHIFIETFQKILQEDGDKYSIQVFRAQPHKPGEAGKEPRPKEKGAGTYHCPMYCEGDKTYKRPGKCPACGMDLVE